MWILTHQVRSSSQGCHRVGIPDGTQQAMPGPGWHQRQFGHLVSYWQTHYESEGKHCVSLLPPFLTHIEVVCASVLIHASCNCHLWLCNQFWETKNIYFYPSLMILLVSCFFVHTVSHRLDIQYTVDNRQLADNRYCFFVLFHLTVC